MIVASFRRNLARQRNLARHRNPARRSFANALKRVSPARSGLTVLLLAAFVLASGGSGTLAASLKPPPAPPAGSWPMPGPTGTWNAIFELTPGETYTYVLTHDVSRNPQRHSGGSGAGSRSGPPATRPGPNHRPITTGELNFTRVRDEIRFWFEVDGVRGNGTAPNDVRALAGAVLVAALTGPEPMSSDGARLLATVFQWTQWHDLFATSTFRNGLVWQVSQHPPHRLTATVYSGRYQYWAELTRGRDVILELGVDVREPVPWDIVAYHGRDVYRAELVPTSGPGLRR